MLQTETRSKGVIPLFSLIFDGIFTGLAKKYKCEHCHGTVFTYYDRFVTKLECDVVNNPEKSFYNDYAPLNEVECTRRYMNEYGYTSRCRTFYILCRPKLGVD